jgi:flagellar protein FlbT
MSCLVLSLRAGEVLLINGARIRFRTGARFELSTHARFVFGKQVMSPEEANTPARRFYFALQTAHVGAAEERVSGLETARALAPVLKAAADSASIRDAVDSGIAAAEADDGFGALRLARLLVRSEAALLSGKACESNLGLETTAKTAVPNSEAAPRTTSVGA